MTHVSPGTPELWDEALALFGAFTRNYLEHAVASRWRVLLESGKPKQWAKINPWAVWDESRRKPGPTYVELRQRLVDAIASLSPPLRPQDRVFFFGLGHSTNELTMWARKDLAEVPGMLEGVVLFAGRSEGLVLH